MVPGIAEREIRQHAHQRQEWLQSESVHSSSSSLAGRRFGMQAPLSLALNRVHRAITGLVCRETTGEVQVDHARPIRLETVRQ